MFGPARIVCLTEETCEWLYLLGEAKRIVGSWRGKPVDFDWLRTRPRSLSRRRRSPL